MGIDTQIKALTHLLDSKYLSSGGRLRPLDFSRLAQFFTLDVITEVAFGEAFGFLLKDDDINGYCRVAEQALPVFEWLGVFPTLNKIIRLPGIRSLVMPSAKDATGVGMMMGYFNNNFIDALFSCYANHCKDMPKGSLTNASTPLKNLNPTCSAHSRSTASQNGKPRPKQLFKCEGPHLFRRPFRRTY